MPATVANTLHLLFDFRPNKTAFSAACPSVEHRPFLFWPCSYGSESSPEISRKMPDYSSKKIEKVKNLKSANVHCIPFVDDSADKQVELEPSFVPYPTDLPSPPACSRCQSKCNQPAGIFCKAIFTLARFQGFRKVPLRAPFRLEFLRRIKRYQFWYLGSFWLVVAAVEVQQLRVELLAGLVL